MTLTVGGKNLTIKYSAPLCGSQLLRDELEAMSLQFPKPVADLSASEFE